MSALEDALARSRELIRGALADAQEELAAVNARRAELEQLIAQAEAALGGAPTPTAPVSTMTLHEALALVLRQNGNRPMTVRQLADAVNQRGLYRKRDGTPVEVNQVHARTSNYSDLFEKDGAMIRLREESPVVTSHSRAISHFRDDDEGFLDWIAENPDGYFINTERNPKPNYLVLHRSTCPHLKGSSDLHWTKDYVKFCSTDSGELEEWAVQSVGGEPTLCRSCFGQRGGRP